MNATAAAMNEMIPVARPFLGEAEEAGVLAVLRSGWLTQGPRVEDFEKRFASYVGCEHAIAVTSCTTGLQLAMWVIGVEAGDEVICPSLSFIATANCIAYNGGRAVFADVDLETYNMDPNVVEDLITERTKAILVVHQIGLPAQLSALKKIAEKHGLFLIEDAACAIGSECDGQRIGSPVGDLACFSFHPRKILTTGEGGMITTNSPVFATKLRRLRQHAMSLSDLARHHAKQIAVEAYGEIGFNYRMTDLQAAVGVAQLDRLDAMLAKRRFLGQRYTDRLHHLSWLRTPHVPQNCRHNYQSYMVRLTGPAAQSRDQIMQDLLEQNISTRRAVMAIHREQPYLEYSSDELLPRTSLLADTGLILPLFHEMTLDQQDRVIAALCAAAS